MEGLRKRGPHPVVQQGVAHLVRRVGDNLDHLRGKRLLVTGGTGFIGIWLLEVISWLNDRWDQPCRVYVTTRDPKGFALRAPHLAARADIVLLRSDVRFLEYPDDVCDFIIHAAAPADPQSLVRDPFGVADTIVNGTRLVLELAARKQVEGFLFVSSGAVYGTQPPDLKLVPEGHVGGPDIGEPRSAYGEAKRYAEVLCALYGERFGVPVHIARPFTFVGPYQDLNAGFAVTDFIRDGLQGFPLRIQGDGTTIRSYCYAPDLVAALWKILLEAPVGRVYNVGSDEPISILGLAHQVAAVLDMPVEIVVTGTPVPGRRPARYVPDVSRAKSELGWAPYTELGDALRHTISWMKDTQYTD